MGKKRIGLLGGISLASTIKYYQTITDLYYKEFNDYYYPEIIIHSLDFQHFTNLENHPNLCDYENYIAYAIHCLENAGAEFIVMAANSPHSVLSQIEGRTALPILSIVDAVGLEAQKRSMKKLLLTGIKHTMQSDFYKVGLERYDIQILTPSEAEQETINNMIFSELVLNDIKDESREKFIEIIKKYPVDGVILGCTELPLLIDENTADGPPLLNSLSLHCAMTLSYALD